MAAQDDASARVGAPGALPAPLTRLIGRERDLARVVELLGDDPPADADRRRRRRQDARRHRRRPRAGPGLRRRRRPGSTWPRWPTRPSSPQAVAAAVGVREHRRPAAPRRPAGRAAWPAAAARCSTTPSTWSTPSPAWPRRCWPAAPTWPSWSPAASRSASPARWPGASRRWPLPDADAPLTAGRARRRRGGGALPRAGAGGVQPTSPSPTTNAAAVAEVCRRLDGIPLAIELAAARVRVLPVEEIARRLDDRFRLLTGGGRTAPPRQQTLRATLDWSHDLLTEPERALLRRLAVFVGGWTLEAAEAVGAGDGLAADAVLDLLTRLVDKSLAQVDEGAAGEGRYRLLETVRQYAAGAPGRGGRRGRGGARPARRLLPGAGRAGDGGRARRVGGLGGPAAAGVGQRLRRPAPGGRDAARSSGRCWRAGRSSSCGSSPASTRRRAPCWPSCWPCRPPARPRRGGRGRCCAPASWPGCRTTRRPPTPTSARRSPSAGRAATGRASAGRW